jgi:hypothetical protein
MYSRASVTAADLPAWQALADVQFMRLEYLDEIALDWPNEEPGLLIEHVAEATDPAAASMGVVDVTVWLNGAMIGLLLPPDTELHIGFEHATLPIQI